MTTTTDTRAIDSTSKASRYLTELVPMHGLRDAIGRIKARATPHVADELEQLTRYVDGAQTQRVAAELAFLGEFLKQLPDKAQAGRAIATINRALEDARAFAADVRIGLPGDLYYLAALLGIALIVTSMWFVQIAPTFTQLFTDFGGTLPSVTQTMLDWPWLPFLVIGVLALAVTLVLIGMRRLAAAIESLAPLAPNWLGLVCGARVVGAHERWRVAIVANGWVQAGRQPTAALDDAIDKLRASATRLNDLLNDVRLAHEIGLAAHELEHQSRSSLDAYRAAVENRRAVVTRVLQITIAVIVGAIVIAMYLPIFGLGAVV